MTRLGKGSGVLATGLVLITGVRCSDPGQPLSAQQAIAVNAEFQATEGGEKANPCVGVRRVGVTTNAPSVEVGESFVITAKPLDKNGEEVTRCSLAWRDPGPQKRGAIAVIMVGAAAGGGGAGAIVATMKRGK